MKANILIISFFLLMTNCSPSIELLSKVKQVVIPGRHTESTYINYVLKFAVNTDRVISIDSIQVIKDENCYRSKNYLLKKEKSASYSDKITAKGSYFLEIPLKEKNIVIMPNCKNKNDEVMIYYKEENVPKKIPLNDFKEERKTKRS